MAASKPSTTQKTQPKKAVVQNAKVSKPKRKPGSRPPAARTEGFNVPSSHTNHAVLGFWYGCPDHNKYLTTARSELTRHLHDLKKHPNQDRSPPEDEELEEYVFNMAEAYEKLGQEEMEKRVKTAMNRIAKHQGWDEKAGTMKAKTAEATSEASAGGEEKSTGDGEAHDGEEESDGGEEEGNEDDETVDGEEQSGDGQQAEEI